MTSIPSMPRSDVQPSRRPRRSRRARPRIHGVLLSTQFRSESRRGPRISQEACWSARWMPASFLVSWAGSKPRFPGDWGIRRSWGDWRSQRRVDDAPENLLETEEAGMRGVGFGAAPARADLFIILAGVVAVVAAAIAADGGAAAAPTVLTVVLAANIATFAMAGLLWRNSRPSSRIGTLLLLEALLVAVSSLAASRHPDAHLVGVLAAWAAAIGLVWLVVAFPRARPRGNAWVV